MTSEELVLLRRLCQHSLKIADKRRNTVPFTLNDHQMTYFANQTSRDIIAKSRQLGFSTGILAQYFLDCLQLPNTNAVIISHDNPTTEKLFQKIHFYLKHYPVDVPVSHASKHEIVFPQTDSTFYIGTAGARVFGRGDTINRLHCSEYAFWANPEQIMRGLVQAVPYDGRIVIESTSNGQGNSYHRRCLKAASGMSNWRMHFYPFFLAGEYYLTPPDDFSPNDEEMAYVERVFREMGVLLNLGQLQWRRFKLDELEEDRQLGISPEQFFDQEYPYSLEVSFLASGSGVFAQLQLQPNDLPRNALREGPLWMFEEPDKDGDYVIGVDVAEGLLLDKSVLEVIRLEEEGPRQVAEWVSDTIKPDELAGVVANIGFRYNEALLVVERNNHGLTTLSHLKTKYPSSRIYRQRQWGTRDWTDPRGNLLGFRTSSTTKPKMIDDLYMQLRTGMTYYSHLLHDEFASFVETRTENGNTKLGAQQGCHDDRVMALALAVQGAKEYYRTYAKPKEELPSNCLSMVKARLKKEARKGAGNRYLGRTRERLGKSLVDSYLETM